LACHDAADRAPAVLRSEPSRLEATLASAATFERVFDANSSALIHASPFLVFAAAVHHGLDELDRASYVTERFGRSARIPVFDVARLRDFGACPERRLFTVELLASYTKVVSGPVWVRHGQRWRRQRFTELDPARLAVLASQLPEPERPGVYRRLGDLALFLTGVFPDFVARQPVAPVDRHRLLRSVRDLPDPAPGDLDEVSGAAGPLLGWLGPHWYRMAARATPLRPLAALLREVSSRFDDARRLLTVITDRFLLPTRGELFPRPGL
jgi:hypothetical protein